MKKPFLFSLLSVIVYLTGIISAQNPDLKTIQLDSKSKTILENFTRFSGNEDGVNPKYGIYRARPTDGALLLINSQCNDPVQPQPFYILEHEITNFNYREFINWVEDSLKRAALTKKGIKGFKTASGEINFDKVIDESDPDIKNALSGLYDQDDKYFSIPAFKKELLVYQVNQKHEVHIYPDTTCFASHGYFEPWGKMYFWHPSYDNYPVVGVSWEQAMAYCTYLAKTRGKMIMENLGLPKPPVFRLPTEEEWIYAAASGEHLEKEKQEKQTDDRKLFPWRTNNSFLFSTEKGQNIAFLCNFGSIIDQNGVLLKHPAQDNARGPIAVGSYSLDRSKIFDMGGNVAEWTMNQPRIPEFFTNPFPKHDSLNQAVYQNEKIDLTSFDKEQIIKEAAKLYPGSKERQKLLVDAVFHDFNVLADASGLKIVKGGSWTDPPIYLMCRTREVRDKNYKSARIGFRVVMEAKVEHDGKEFLLRE